MKSACASSSSFRSGVTRSKNLLQVPDLDTVVTSLGEHCAAGPTRPAAKRLACRTQRDADDSALVGSSPTSSQQLDPVRVASWSVLVGVQQQHDAYRVYSIERRQRAPGCEPPDNHGARSVSRRQQLRPCRGTSATVYQTSLCIVDGFCRCKAYLILPSRSTGSSPVIHRGHTAVKREPRTSCRRRSTGKILQTPQTRGTDSPPRGGSAGLLLAPVQAAAWQQHPSRLPRPG